MEQEYRHAIALMRYSAIAPLIPGLPEGYRNLADYLEKTSQKGLLHPDGEVRNYAPKTLYKWYFSYQKGGFDALLPAGRNDCGRSRKLDDDLKEKISYLKGRYPRMGAAAIFRQLKEDGSIKGGEVSESTVNRYVNRLALEAGSTPVQDMRRYERPHVNEVWCGDSSVGPYLRTADGRKRRVYVIALIDDASRLVTGAGVFFEDTFVNLMSVMKSAVAKYGVPRMFNFDNGSAYKNKQMELLAARDRNHHQLLQTLYPDSQGQGREMVPDHEGPVDGLPGYAGFPFPGGPFRKPVRLRPRLQPFRPFLP